MPKHKSNEPTAGERVTHKSVTSTGEAAYFLSLSLQDVRCFGPQQSLDLSNGAGRPAQWTVILGLNGTGKTTILQLLAGAELLPHPSADRSLPRILHHPWTLSESLRRINTRSSSWRINTDRCVSLTEAPEKTSDCRFEIFEDGINWN